MARVLHLLTPDGDTALALAVIGGQVAGGDAVTVALLQGAPPPALPAGVAVRRVPEETGYPELLDEVFAADHVITW